MNIEQYLRLNTRKRIAEVLAGVRDLVLRNFARVLFSFTVYPTWCISEQQGSCLGLIGGAKKRCWTLQEGVKP